MSNVSAKNKNNKLLFKLTEEGSMKHEKLQK